jgi:hypothetical protein
MDIVHLISEETFLRAVIKLWDATKHYREQNQNFNIQEFEDMYKHTEDFWKENYSNEPRPKP